MWNGRGRQLLLFEWPTTRLPVAERILGPLGLLIDMRCAHRPPLVAEPAAALLQGVTGVTR